ncbi:MAG: acyl-CoA dehydrogenase family protein [Hyphomonadaceae bacterium]
MADAGTVTAARSPAAGAFRAEVRRFLQERRAHPPDHPDLPLVSASFSRVLGAQGWIGVDWPEPYGRDVGAPARYILLEETLAAGAPTMAHTVAERQTAPLLLRFGTDEQRRRFLPAIARGECFFCIGMSEPNAGSDLAALQMRATPKDDGYVLRGSKLWTSLAHVSHYILVLCRTSDAAERHDGLSQIIVDLRAPGVTISPILNLAGEHEFNQVFFDDVFVPRENLVGVEGAGWRQAMSELAFERGGPDRFLMNVALFAKLIDALAASPSEMAAAEVGRLTAQLAALRQLACDVFETLSRGGDAGLSAALVKDLGAAFEQDLAESMRRLIPLHRRRQLIPGLSAQLEGLILRAPSFSIRGGAREVLRGVIAKALADR